MISVGLLIYIGEDYSMSFQYGKFGQNHWFVITQIRSLHCNKGNLTNKRGTEILMISSWVSGDCLKLQKGIWLPCRKYADLWNGREQSSNKSKKVSQGIAWWDTESLDRIFQQSKRNCYFHEDKYPETFY